MIEKDLHNILQDKEQYKDELIQSLLSTIQSLTLSNQSMSKTISSLQDEIASLKEILLSKDIKVEKLANKLNGLSKIALPKKSEKQSKQAIDKAPTVSAKERGNNGAKRKELNIEEDTIPVDPDDVDFNANEAKFIATRDVIRYEYIAAKLIKRIYKCNRYSQDGKIYEGKAPISPFLNSNYSSSFFAYLLQQRYVYGMPIERIMRMLNEYNVDIPKPTLHGLIKKSAELMDILQGTLKNAILSSPYLHFDETYHTVLDKKVEKGSKKGYFWAVLAHDTNLMQFFYDNGSRTKKVFTDYFPKNYKGAVQTDAYKGYDDLEGWAYIDTIHLACIQHCKRKFIDIETHKEARCIIDIFNEFYLIRKNKNKKDWIRLSLKVYDRLKKKLADLIENPKIIANKILFDAVKYSNNRLPSIYNIIANTEYDLDNNSIERPMRYISISRRNSLFCGSHAAAQRMSLIYSLAISCRLNNVNSFTYFNWLITELAKLPPKPDPEILRNLLPDKISVK